MNKLAAIFGHKKPNLREMRIAELERAMIRKFELMLELDQIRAAISGCEERIKRLDGELANTPVNLRSA